MYSYSCHLTPTSNKHIIYSAVLSPNFGPPCVPVIGGTRRCCPNRSLKRHSPQPRGGVVSQILPARTELRDAMWDLITISPLCQHHGHIPSPYRQLATLQQILDPSRVSDLLGGCRSHEQLVPSGPPWTARTQHPLHRPDHLHLSHAQGGCSASPCGRPRACSTRCFLMNVPLCAPDYSCVSKRASRVKVAYRPPPQGEHHRLGHLCHRPQGLWRRRMENSQTRKGEATSVTQAPPGGGG